MTGQKHLRRALTFFGLLSFGCNPDALPPAQPVIPIGQATQRSFLPADPYEDARRAIADRVERRERMFHELFTPGSLWNTLRIEQEDIDTRRIPLPKLTEIGRDLFTIDFDRAHGLGNGLAARKSPLAGPRPAPNLRHVQYKQFGGPDATRCVACHHLGGVGGSGFRIDNVFYDGDGRTSASGLERNPRSLLGAAVIARLGEEMSAELKTAAFQIFEKLAPGGSAPLEAKGVKFGIVRRAKDGRLDLTGVRGVAMNLMVHPFGWKGTESSLRQMVENSMQLHLGIQPEGLIKRLGKNGESMLGDGPEGDPDNDGVRREATEGMVTAISAYIASLGLPTEETPEEMPFLYRSAMGPKIFERIGCAGCHVPELPLNDPVISLGPTPHSWPRIDLTPLFAVPGEPPPQKPLRVRIYSDFKRHDMGDGLAESRADRSIPKNLWMTPPLWGLAATLPYLHDGRAGSIEAAILAHGGEAEAAREAYKKLSFEEGSSLRLFLQSLGRPHSVEFKP